jgi:hypothetical protein
LPSRYDDLPGRPRRHLLIATLVLAVLVPVYAGPVTPAAHAQSSNDPRTERDKVRAERAEVASQVDALRADDAEVDAALAALDDNLRGKNAAYADAERAAADAEREVSAARQALADKQAEIDAMRAQLADIAVAAYVNPPGEEFLDSFRADSATDSVRKRAFLDARSGRGTDLLDQLRAAEEELSQARQAAEQAEIDAASRRDAARAQLSEAEAARAQQAAFADQVAARLDATLGEAAALAATDKELSDQISRREAELAQALARSRAANPAPSGGGGGAVVVTGPVPLTNVRGIVVNSSIAGQLESLLAAAEGAGIVMGGTGYRDSSAQIALRRQNCGTSDYAIYQMPAEQCSPATARPGLSKHEQGLAVDFTVGGRTLSSGSAAFGWMSANAGRWGWVNLPGEPWHWSVGGG